MMLPKIKYFVKTMLVETMFLGTVQASSVVRWEAGFTANNGEGFFNAYDSPNSAKAKRKLKIILNKNIGRNSSNMNYRIYS